MEVSTENITTTSTDSEENEIEIVIVDEEGLEADPDESEETEETEDETTEGYIMVDDSLYLSETSYFRSLDDCYAMLLSCRNILLLWFLIWCVLKVKTMIHNSIQKYMGV